MGESVKLEYENAEILRKNLAAARKTINKQAARTGFASRQFQQTLDSALDEFAGKAQDKFKLTAALQMGIDQGKILAAEMLTGGDPKRQSQIEGFLGWRPVLPINAISIKSSEFANLIKGLTSDYKEEILRKVQQGLALGMTTQELQEQILGTGLKGLMGRDGVWRKATQRAETIGRTVSNDLINYGAQITYLQMGQISPEAGFQKVWQTTSDNRTSDICKALAEQRVSLDSEFFGGGWRGQRPPAHPNCRSRITLVAKSYTKDMDGKYKATYDTTGTTQKKSTGTQKKSTGTRKKATGTPGSQKKDTGNFTEARLKKELDALKADGASKFKQRNLINEYVNAQRKPKAVSIREATMAKSELFNSVELDGMTYYYPNDDVGAMSLVTKQLDNMLDGDPISPGLAKHSNRVILTTQRNTDDDYWAKKYNKPGFRSAATGGTLKTITVYNGTPVSKGTIAHEMGHNLATAKYGSTHPPASSEFYQATLSWEGPPSEYGKNSISEDYAETAMFYEVDREWLKLNYPLRYRAIKRDINS
jgi:hypothetical protein